MPLISRHRREDLHVKHVEIAYSFASVQPANSFHPVQLSGHALLTFDTKSTFDSGASHVTSLRENARARSMFFVADQ